jgi:hypothetical protein
MPSDQTSVLWSISFAFLTCSGDMNMGEPRMLPVLVSPPEVCVILS